MAKSRRYQLIVVLKSWNITARFGNWFQQFEYMRGHKIGEKSLVGLEVIVSGRPS